MTRILRQSSAAWLVLPVWVAVSLGQASAQLDETPEEEDRQARVIERFMTLLERNPRRGTALDRVYGHHVERGTVEEFVDSLTAQARESKDGVTWMIAGLLEYQRGREAAAVEAFHQAESLRPDDPLAAFYLGQSLAMVGGIDDAAAAYERALQRNPNRADMLEIFQDLGRIYQRAQRNEEALDIWDRLEKEFPGDERVQAEVAGILAEEGRHKEALDRYEKLAKLTNDEYHRVSHAIKAAELEARLGRPEAALRRYEQLLEDLNPESWLYADVREHIEAVFLRSDDYAGLASYYEQWLKEHPQDIQAMTRAGRTLASQGRYAESRDWLEKALKLAPSDVELRLSLIDMHVATKDFTEAAAEYARLEEFDPANPDHIREWGEVVLKDTKIPEDERRTKAAQIWRRLLEGKSEDPVTVVQVADLFRQARMTDGALELYRGAVELAPDDPAYREYLGEYYHTLKRKDEALKTWGYIAEGQNRTAGNLVRLSKILHQFRYLKEAIAALQQAAELGIEFTDQIKLAELLREDEQTQASLDLLDEAAGLAETTEEHELLLDERLKSLVQAGKLSEEIETLKQHVEAADPPTADQWYRLARYYEADSDQREASQAIGRAIELDKQSAVIWQTAVRILETSGRFADAAAAGRHLAVLDARYRTEHLKNVASLEMRLGRGEAALQAAKDVVAGAPGNPGHYRFYAELCFQLDKPEEAFDALRRSVRVNPSDVEALEPLAQALSDHYRTDEAIELYWRIFDAATDLAGQLSAIERLAPLYLRTNHFDRLTDRLTRLSRESESQRDATICLAQAYRSAGNPGAARRQLETLLSEDSRDPLLLEQLVKISESEGDIEKAITYQRRLNEIAPDERGTQNLARLYSQIGDAQNAASVLVEYASTVDDPKQLLAAVDSLVANQRYEDALLFTQRIMREQPDDWQVAYRHGEALHGLRRSDDAQRQFEALLDLEPADDSSASTGLTTRTNTFSTRAGVMAYQQNPFYQRMSSMWQLRQVVGLEQNQNRQVGFRRRWKPQTLDQARTAALAFLYAMAQQNDQLGAFSDKYKPAAGQVLQNKRAAWDWLYLQYIVLNYREAHEISKALSQELEPKACFAYLTTLPQRGYEIQFQGGRAISRSNNFQPLSQDEMDHVLKCLEVSDNSYPHATNGYLTQNVVTELERSQRHEEADELYATAIAAAERYNTTQNWLHFVANRGDMQTFVNLQQQQMRTNQGRARAVAVNQYTLMPLIDKRAKENAHADVLLLLDMQLQLLRGQNTNRMRASSANRLQLNPNRSTTYIQTYQSSSNSWSSVELDYPTPNLYYDQNAIALLRSVYDVFKRDDLLTDLTGHFRKQLEDAEGEEAIYPGLALTYFAWWENQQGLAAGTLRQAVDKAPESFQVRLELADLRRQMGQLDEALELIDETEPRDHADLQRREALALQLAASIGDKVRARKAAEQLFGYRLDANSQMQLANYMRQLGMEEMAKSVLDRVRQQSGAQSSTLVALMQQYQQQGDNEIAAEVAYQVLRRESINTSGNSSSRSARQQAIAVLASSGRLEKLIERVESQLEGSPDSLRLLRTLADYYGAARNYEKARETYARAVALKPDDTLWRYQIASDMADTGDHSGAADQYLAVFRQDPSLMGRNDSYQVQRTFQQAKRLAELAELMSESDLSKLQRPYVVTNLVQQMASTDGQWQAQAVALIRKAWKTFPDQRELIVGNIYREELWKLPEMVDFIGEVIIPASGQPQNAWSGIDRVMRYGQDGRAVGLVTYFLEGVDTPQKISSLKDRINKGLQAQPGWEGGKLLLAVLESREGNSDAAEKLVREVLSQEKQPVPVNAAWLIGQELESNEQLAEVTIALYAKVLDSATRQQTNWWQGGFASRVTDLFVKLDRQSEARRLLMRAFENRDTSRFQSASWNSGLLHDADQTAARFIDIGFPVDAIRIYNDMNSSADPTLFQTAEPYAAGGALFKMTVESGLSRARRSLDKDSLRRMLIETVDPEAVKLRRAGTPPVDMVMIVQAQALRSAHIIGVFQKALEVVDEPVLDQVDAHLDELETSYPEDFSIYVARTLVASARRKPESVSIALNRLVETLRDNPLDELGESARPNARQRREAADRLVLWPAVQVAWQRPETEAVGDELADGALEAARRQFDRNWALAMLRVRGARAMEAGDPQGAETFWSEMLDLVSSLPGGNAIPADAASRPRQKIKFSGTVAKVKPGAADAESGAADAPPTKTLDAYRKLIQIAKLTAESGMHELSLKSVSMALAGGPPLQPGSNSNLAAGVGTSPADQEVEQDLFALNQLWRRNATPPEDICATLRQVVLPPGRPKQVQLYPAPTIRTGVDRPRSVARLLAETAADAGLESEFAAVVAEARQRQDVTLEPDLLQGHFAVAARDAAACEQAFSALEEWLERVSDPATAEITCHVACPALFDDDLCDGGDRLLTKAFSNMIAANREEPLGALLLLSARALFERGEVEQALDRIESYETFFEGQNSKLFGDFAKLRHKEQLVAIIAELTRAGQVTAALDRLATYQSIKTLAAPQPAPTGSEISLLRQLASLPAEQCYEVLAGWTFPPQDTGTVRMAAGFVPVQRPPPVFRVSPSTNSASTGQPLPEFLTSAGLLVSAADRLGRVDELTASLAGRGSDSPAHRLVLLEIALAKQDRAQLRTMAEDLLKEAESSSQPAAAVAQLDPVAYALAKACLASPESAEIGQRLLRAMLARARTTQDDDWRARLQVALLRADGSQDAPATPPPGDVWIPTTHMTADAHAAGRPSSLWLRQGQNVQHSGGSEQQYLFLAYPLAGEFRFSVQTQDVPGAEGHLSYGGLTFEILGRSGHGSIWSAGRNMLASNRCTSLEHGEFNTLSVEANDHGFRYLVNGEVYYEQAEMLPGNPWLGLFADRGRQATFRNFELVGSPKIPREVPLSGGDSLRGWVSNFYGETQPPSSLAAVTAVLPDPTPSNVREDHDWSAVGGVIHGRRSSADCLTGPLESRLYYQRPLLDGESLSYEFFYAPGAVEVHPALGRVCFVLRPEGLNLHWITDGDDKESSGLESGHMVAIKDSPPVPLKPHAWNTVRLSLQHGRAKLTLNGSPVHSQPVGSDNSGLFSLFHFKDQTTAEVRNVVLQGDWPDTLDPSEIVQVPGN